MKPESMHHGLRNACTTGPAYAVTENHRGQHIGRAIYNEILRYAKARRCYNVTLNVWCCNPTAMAFYESLGMKPQKIGMETVL